MSQARDLQQALDRLLSEVSIKANRKEEDFFKEIREQLCDLCSKIADEVGADSAAIFFMTEDNRNDPTTYMVMRGASGQLRCTFDKRVRDWDKWRGELNSAKAEELADLKGFVYSSKLEETIDPRQQPREWSVTNQIWHLAEGRIANSNRAMDELHGGRSRTGRADEIAYPGKNLHTTFRTMVGIPIFAQGENIQTVQLEKDQKGNDGYPSSASASAEFLSRYRVIGILKVEGKRPLDEEIPDTMVLERMLNECYSDEEIKKQISDCEKKELLGWCKELCVNIKSLKAGFQCEGTEFPHFLQDQSANRGRKIDKEERKPLLLRKAVADIFSRCCHAEFTRQDIELLVLLAMQVGRLMTRRIMKHAADNGIVISETELGLLNVRWRDIDDLVALRMGAEAAMRKVKFHLDALKAELDFHRRQEVFHARVSELLDPHGPIREVTERCKEFISLIRKLVRKERRLEDDSPNCEISFTAFKCEVAGYGSRSGERCMMQGSTKLFIHPSVGGGQVDMTMKLGIEDAPRVVVDSRNLPATLTDLQKAHDPHAPLVQRILDPKCYDVDDIGGTRVITDYDSDIDEVLDELQIHEREWGMKIGKVDDLREGEEGGYRGVHVRLLVDVRQLLPESDLETLRQALGRQDEPLEIPVEIQLRTAYQHSWALKTHAISYKREERISQELRDEQEILSNVLAQADWLSGIVRSRIEDMLLPPDYGERRLLDFLERRIPPDDMRIVKFGLACAKEILKDQLRYNGQPEYSFAMEVCERLVYSFGVIDSRMLLLALLRNIWRLERRGGEPTQTSTDIQPQDGEKAIDIIDPLIASLNERLEQTCPLVWQRYKQRLGLPFEREAYEDWFWIMQANFRAYFRRTKKNRQREWTERLQNVYSQLQSLCRDKQQKQETLDEWLERAYLMEAAVLQANLLELPFEPGTMRRKGLHDSYLSLYREIRKYFPNTPTKAHVVEELEHTFMEMETLLDLPRESEWWSS
jgi:ppGpp synthetase/RelA/SpoT-type nucleotidyltranferase